MALKGRRNLSDVMLCGAGIDPDVLWRLEARTERVPAPNGLSDGSLPGVQSLRTLWMRGADRDMETVKGPVKYLDPLLFDMFLMSKSRKSTGAFSLTIFGVTVQVMLADDCRIQAAPTDWQPRFVPKKKAGLLPELRVAPFQLMAGTIRIKDEGQIRRFLPDAEKNSAPDIELDRDGILFTVSVMPPAGTLKIDTRLRLSLVNGKLCVTLQPLLQSTQANKAWGDVWHRLQEMALQTRATAWSRLSFKVGRELPALSWIAEVKNDQISVEWQALTLPDGLLSVTLADQPVESQILGPERVMTLLPSNVSLFVKDNMLVVEAGNSQADSISNVTYSWKGGDESLSLTGKPPMVHVPQALHDRLRSLQGGDKVEPATALTGFLKLAEGWLELPFSGDVEVASTLSYTDSSSAQGSLLIGQRREAFYAPGQPVDSVPWSLEIDEPGSHYLYFAFDLQQKKPGDIVVHLHHCPLRIRGLLWLSNRNPDGHDALPVMDDAADGFFDVPLMLCNPATGSVPFRLRELTVSAPRKKNADTWDDKDQLRKPSLSTNAGLEIYPNVLARDVKEDRLWLRHPTLPSIQAVPLTRSNLSSTRPHVSRSMSLFQRPTAMLPLELLGAMAPSVTDKAVLNQFKVETPVPLAALTLPGIELWPTTPEEWQVLGRYTLPVFDEIHASAIAPPPFEENKDAIAAPPIVTALDPLALASMHRERETGRVFTTAQASLMFDKGNANARIPLRADGMAEPYKWSANVTVSDAVGWTTDGRLRIGSLAFKQTAAAGSLWSPPGFGNDLLEGANGGVVFSGTTARIDSTGSNLSGWALEERLVGNFIVDGRGVGWGVPVHDVPANLLFTPLQLEGDAKKSRLVSAAVPISIGGAGTLDWCFEFTDIPLMSGALTWRPGTIAEARCATFANSWTWCLYKAGQLQQQRLMLARNFTFTPAALTALEFHAIGGLRKVTIEGTLTLGVDNPSLVNDSLRRVELTLTSTDGKRLTVFSIKSLHDSTGCITWDLDAEREAGTVVSGITRLSGIPKVTDVGIDIGSARVFASLLSSQVDLDIGTIADNTWPTDKPFVPDREYGKLKVVGLEIDLERARLIRVELAVSLRSGIWLRVSESVRASQPRLTTWQLDWFGNRFSGASPVIDARRRTIQVQLTDSNATEVVIVPDEKRTARLNQGAICLVFGAADNEGVFTLLTQFSELILRWDTLTLSHMMQMSAKASSDWFRFDGTLSSGSLVTWPAFSESQLSGVGDSLNLDFATGENLVRHAASFLLSDHRLAGSSVDTGASGKGIALNGTEADEPAATWLVEGNHQLEWRGTATPIIRRFRCLHALQLWSGVSLARKASALAKLYGFTPSYCGSDNSVPGFPNAGVRRIEEAYTGLFENVAKWREPGDLWVLLGGLSLLYPHGPEEDFTPLHLPYIAAFGLREKIDALGQLFQVPERTAVIQVSRHDLPGRTLKLNAAGFDTPGLLAKALPVQGVPFSSAYRSTAAISGDALAAGWFIRGEHAWQVEQIQVMGKSPRQPPLPFAFPRAALMLARLAENDALQPDRLPVSVLTRFVGAKGAWRVEVKLVLLSSLVTLEGSSDTKGSAQATCLPGDLVVGSADGLHAVPFADSGSEPRQALAVALDYAVEPSFVLVRRTTFDQISFERVDIPRAEVDALQIDIRPLSGQPVKTDGRICWPIPAKTAIEKDAMQVQFGQRTSMRDTVAAVSATTLQVQPPGLCGAGFDLGCANGEQTVWLQDWNRLVFESQSHEPAITQPFTHESAVAAKPVLPPTRSLAAAIRRMDPVLPIGVRIQTYLPPVFRDVDLFDRSGVYDEMGIRVVYSPEGTDACAAVQAIAGPAITRSMRRPRPLALPQNADKPGEWRRTLGWYGEPGRSCLTLVGAWEMICSPPDESWCLLLGQPAPKGGAPWDGSLVVRCRLLRGEPHAQVHDPAGIALALMRNVVRAGLRRGPDWIAFSRVRRLDEDHLLFLTEPGKGRAQMFVSQACSFVLGMEVPKDVPEATHDEMTSIGRSSPGGLDKTSVQSLMLPVSPPVFDEFPLPVVRRTVFFSDPAYDRVLGRIEALTARSSPGQGTSAPDGFTFWLDRPSVAPGETMVLQVVKPKDGKNPVTFRLEAKVLRKDDSETRINPLGFILNASESVPDGSVDIIENTPCALPLSTLVDRGKTLDPGDVLILEASAIADPKHTAILIVPVKAQSALATPEALYSLIAIDSVQECAWCALHSSKPSPEGLITHVMDKNGVQTLTRRARFIWSVTTEAPRVDGLAFSLIKHELTTEAAHIPDCLENELKDD